MKVEAATVAAGSQAPPEIHPAFSVVGIEIEYMIVEAQSLDVLPIADELLRAAGGGYTKEVARGDLAWSNELMRHLVEIKNQRPSRDLPALATAFQSEVAAIEKLLAPFGARLLPGGMHPWMDPGRQACLWNREGAELYQTYDRLFGCRRHGWANVQSVHINLPFADDAEFARLHRAIRLVLPILPALAASSPFADGRATGFLDYRLEVYREHQARYPATVGDLIPEPVGSGAEYQQRILRPMYRQIAADDPAGELQHEWLNARAAIARFDRQAIEIRLLDVQECPRADLAVAAAVVALVRRFYCQMPSLPAPDSARLAGILRACGRDAERALINDSDYLALFDLTRPCTAGDIWSRVLDNLGESDGLAAAWREPLGTILDHGPLARRLLAAAGPEPSHERLREVYLALADCLRANAMFANESRNLTQ